MATAPGAGKYSRGRQQDILQYFWNNPDRGITIEELTKHFKGTYDRGQIMGTMAHVTNGDMQKKYNYPVKKLHSGAWQFDPPGDKKSSVTQSLERLTVTIIKEVDGEMVVVDDDAHIYRMVQVA